MKSALTCEGEDSREHKFTGCETSQAAQRGHRLCSCSVFVHVIIINISVHTNYVTKDVFEPRGMYKKRCMPLMYATKQQSKRMLVFGVNQYKALRGIVSCLLKLNKHKALKKRLETMLVGNRHVLRLGNRCV